MPIQSIKLRPGINKEFTPALNEGGWSDSNLIRFKSGLPQKVGGWEKFYPFSVNSPIRALHAWQDLNAVDHLAEGSQSSLGVVTSEVLTNITPQTVTTDPTINFSTTNASPTVTIVDSGVTNVTTYDSVYFNTPIAVGGLVLAGLYPIINVAGANSYQITASANATSTVASGGAVPSFAVSSGSPTVTVTFASHGGVVGGNFTFPIATTVGGITISGTYEIVTVPTANTLTITASQTASSTTSASMNGGNAQIVYYISLGPAATGSGYGRGGYGAGGYSSGTTSSVQSGTPITVADYSLDNWGKTLLACPENGGLYSWDPDGGFLNGSLVSTANAPIFNATMFVAQPAQILVTLGSTTQKVSGSIGVYQDPLLIRWSDQDDYTNWSIDTTNQVGSVRLPRGSTIVGGIQAPNQALVWTDIAVWSMQYIGQPLVFGTNEIASGCGLIAKHARCVLRNSVYWFSQQNFYMLVGGGVQVMPCSVWDVVFQDLDTDNASKCWAWANSLFNEVWFFYPSIQDGTGECSRYAKCNVAEGMVWDVGQMQRSAGIDQTVLGPPIAGTSSGIIYQHETSNDGDGSPINAYVQSGEFLISDGQWVTFCDQVRPDMKFGQSGQPQTAVISVTIDTENDITGEQQTSGALIFTAQSTYLTPRIRGHRASVRIESSDLGSWWRMGRMRFRATPDGRV